MKCLTFGLAKVATVQHQQNRILLFLQATGIDGRFVPRGCFLFACVRWAHVKHRPDNITAQQAPEMFAESTFPYCTPHTIPRKVIGVKVSANFTIGAIWQYEKRAISDSAYDIKRFVIAILEQYSLYVFILFCYLSPIHSVILIQNNQLRGFLRWGGTC